MATYPFPYPSAATYPPPIFPGGYCTAPLPFFSSATPAFPYAAAYPYPPPAPAYASPTSFYPAQPYGPSTVPYATTSSCLTSEATPIPTNVEPNWPSPAPDPTPHILSQPPLARNPSILNQSTPSMATSPIYTSACAPVTSAEGSSATAADLWFNLVDTKPQQHSQVSNTATNQQYSPAFAPALLESAEAQARAEAAISNNMPRAVLDLKHRMDEHHAQFQRSIASLQGQLSKLRDRLSSLTTSSVALSTSSSSPFGASFVASTPKFASLSATKSSTKPSATAYVAPQVFDEMQTPSSSQGTHGSAPDYRSGHHTPIQGTCLRDGNSNLREQNVEGMPQAYGLHNLICRTVVQADGTEHSYYALPGNYPLEQAMPEPLFSNGSVGVFASNPGQQPYEEAQKEGEPLLRCLSKVLETEHTTACLNITSDATAQGRRDATAVYKVLILQLPMSTNSHVWDPGVKIFLCSWLIILTGWSATDTQFPCTHITSVAAHAADVTPGATEFPFLFTTSAGATELQVTDVFKPEFTCSGETPKLLNSWVNLKKMILWPCCKLQISTPSKLSMQSLCETISVKEEKDATPMHMIMVLHLEEVTAGKDGAALYQISTIQLPMRNTTHVWNPGIDSLLLVYIWLHIHKTQLVNCTSTATQSAKWSSTSPNSIASSELDFIIDRWEFLHEQGVKKKYKAKNLLSSPNYLQIKEMDIIFSTFRPP